MSQRTNDGDGTMVVEVGRDEWIIEVIEQFFRDFRAKYPQGLPEYWSDKVVGDIADRAATVLIWELERIQIGPAYSSQELSTRLRISRQAISKRVETGNLIAVKNSQGQFEFPKFQFGEHDEVLPGLVDLGCELRLKLGDDVAVALWLTAWSRDDESAISRLQRGKAVGVDHQPAFGDQGFLARRHIINEIVRAIVFNSRGRKMDGTGSARMPDSDARSVGDQQPSPPATRTTSHEDN